MSQKYILPHFRFFNNDDLRKILTGILDNNKDNPSTCNQIINANGISGFLVDFYKETNKIDNYANLWINFYEKRIENHGKYNNLKQQLISDGLIAEEDPE